MTATLNDQTGRRKRPEPTAEAKAAAELVRAAKEQGLSLTGLHGLLKQLTETVLETALNEAGSADPGRLRLRRRRPGHQHSVQAAHRRPPSCG